MEEKKSKRKGKENRKKGEKPEQEKTMKVPFTQIVYVFASRLAGELLGFQ